MTLQINPQTGYYQHYPHDPERFEFDSEVALTFLDMATRSIPLYHTVHRGHAGLVAAYWAERRPRVVLDIGASTGVFLQHLGSQLRAHWGEDFPTEVTAYAVDQSPAMLEQVQRSLPWVHTVTADITESALVLPLADVINMTYVLQFIPEEQRAAVLAWVYRQLRPGGLLLLAQKENVLGRPALWFDGQYRRFRLDNGYSAAEIDAKNRALRTVMWPVSRPALEAWLQQLGFQDIQATFRWLQFSALLAIKPAALTLGAVDGHDSG